MKFISLPNLGIYAYPLILNICYGIWLSLNKFLPEVSVYDSENIKVDITFMKKETNREN